MRILLTNDDGVNARGIRALANALKREHEVMICAPSIERSGASHSFTFLDPLRAKKVVLPGLEDVEAYAVTGTPVDCVKLAYGNLFTNIDMVVSGINHGANIGTDVFYSGTVSAAMEGAFSGFPSIAVSDQHFEALYLETAAEYARRAVQAMAKMGGIRLLNINVPDLPIDEVRGVKLTRINPKMAYESHYDERIDLFGERYYWTPVGRSEYAKPDADNDEACLRAGYVAMTPLLCDLTDEGTLIKMKEAFNI